jgi:hypothetical protein
MEGTNEASPDDLAEDYRKGIEMHLQSLFEGSERFLLQLGTMQDIAALSSYTPRTTLSGPFPLTGAEPMAIQVPPRSNFRGAAPGPQRRNASRSTRGPALYYPHRLTTPGYHRELLSLVNLPPHLDQIVSEDFTSTELCQLYTGPVEYESEELCPICQEKYGVITEEDPHVEFRCHHRFHTECIEQWLRTSQTCPMCRDNVNIIVPSE